MKKPWERIPKTWCMDIHGTNAEIIGGTDCQCPPDKSLILVNRCQVGSMSFPSNKGYTVWSLMQNQKLLAEFEDPWDAIIFIEAKSGHKFIFDKDNPIRNGEIFTSDRRYAEIAQR